jgi:hypothetical protein
VTHVGKETYLRRCFLVKRKERGRLEDLGFDWRITLKYIVKKLNLMACTGLIWLGIGQTVGSGKHGNECWLFHKMLGIWLVVTVLFRG